MPATLVQLNVPSNEKPEVMSFEPLPEGKALRVLLVYPNVQRVRTPQIGIAILSSCLKRIGADVQLFDITALPRGQELPTFERILEERRPDLLAYSVRSNEWPLTQEMLARGRSRGIIQIAGGPHPTHAPEESIPFVDAVVVGEGEGAVMDIARRLVAGQSLAGIPNTWVNTSAGVVVTPKRDLIHDLDLVPMPDWRLFDELHYRDSYIRSVMGGSVEIVAAIEGSRGCPFTCTYCSNSALMDAYEGHGKWRREKSPERMVAELQAFRAEFGKLDFVYWVDEIWLTGLPRLERFRDLYKAGVGAPFSIMERPECITEDKMRVIADAGLHYVAIGLESGDEDLRTQVLDRRTKLDVLVRAFKLPQQFGVKVHAFTMLGLPGQDESSMMKTWRFMRQAMPDSAQFSIFYPLKGTKLHDQVVQMGLYDPGQSFDNYYSGSPLKQEGIDNALVCKYQRLFSRYAIRPGVWPVIAFQLCRRIHAADWLISTCLPGVAAWCVHQRQRLGNLFRCTPREAMRKIGQNLGQSLRSGRREPTRGPAVH